MKTIVMIMALVSVSTVNAMNIDEYMSVYKSKNTLLKSTELNFESTQGKLAAAEIELAPVFSLGYLKNNDKSLPSQLSPDRHIEQYTAGLGKKFSTGTALQIEGNSLNFENKNAAFPGYDKYATGTLGVTVKQSLWKDSFGHGTRTRIERQKSLATLEITGIDLQKRILLMEAEFIFWDYVFAKQDLVLKKENLDRAVRVQKWAAQRFSNGIGEKADDLNAKALVSLRQMQLLLAESELKNTELKLRQNLEISESEKTPEITSDGKEIRPYLAELQNKKNVIKIETYLSTVEAKSKSLIAEETLDSLRPDLSIFGTYNYTSYNRDRVKAIADMSRPEYPQSVIGVNFTWAIDQVVDGDLRGSMRNEVLAQKMRSDKKTSDGLSSWSEYLRIYQTTLNQTKILEQIAELQKNRSKSEIERYAKGRTVTASVVNAETDSAEAELNYLKAKIGLRKYEATSLTYMEGILK